MDFTALLSLAGLSPTDVAICLHKPGDPVARRALVVMAEERPDLFEAYQSTHSAIQEATVKRRPFFASFVMTASAELTFMNLYERRELQRCSADDFLSDPVFCEMLVQLDSHSVGLQDNAERLSGRLRFELTPLATFAALSKRLVVADPGGRNYVRLAETTPLEILEVKRIAQITPPMPAWDALTLTWAELATLPRDWAIRLSEWRGIYLIVDEDDGARYVGSAYGTENLLGRWRTHVAADTGVTAELRKRKVRRFRFSILELLSPAATPEDVIALEHNWMDRLHTRQFGLNA
jgi:GIY-YIG catalytic domain